VKFLYINLIFLSIITVIQANPFSDIYILQTTDVHSAIFSVPGWLREASLIKNEIKKLGKDKVLLIDCGDSLQGSFSAMVTQGKVGVLMLNELEYDIWVPGNHDFDFGLKIFLDRAEKVKADCLMANSTLLAKNFPPWKIYKKNGLKIAVIGMTFPWTYTMIWGKSIRSTGLIDISNALDSIMEDVMLSKPDIIVLATHRWLYSPKRIGGLSFSKIHEKYPQIDLFLGGHVHQSVEGELTGDGGYAVVAGAHAESLAEIHIKYDQYNKKIANIESALIKVDKTIPEDKSIAEKLTHLRRFIDQERNKPVAFLKDLLSMQKIEEILGKEVCKKTGTDFSLISLPAYIKFLPEGLINREDVFNLEPYEDQIITMTLSLKELKSLFKALFSMKKYQFTFCANLKHTFSFCRKKDEIKKMFSDLPDKKYKLALFSFFAAGAENRLPLLGKIASESSGKAVSTGIKVRDILESVLKKSFPN
jgi:2',3'-cyclic-nucleotide 2'-phosphodiesterase (5'-nucleotidase family)